MVSLSLLETKKILKSQNTQNYVRKENKIVNLYILHIILLIIYIQKFETS